MIRRFFKALCHPMNLTANEIIYITLVQIRAL